MIPNLHMHWSILLKNTILQWYLSISYSVKMKINVRCCESKDKDGATIIVGVKECLSSAFKC